MSDDGITWDVANEFTIREGGVPAAYYDNPGVYQHIGYPSVTLLGDGSVRVVFGGISSTTWIAACTPNDGVVLGSDW